jgi:hypothetical protein
MKIELDGIMLNETQEEASGGITDGRNITNLNVTNKRNSVPHDLPGMMGSAFQDLGRAAVNISFDGIISGQNAKSLLESLRGKFQKGEPVPFNSDLSGTADITKVLIDDFKVLDTAGSKDRYAYSIVLKEYKEPPPKSITPESLEGLAGEWASNMVDDILAAAKDEALGFVGSELGDGAKGIAGAAFDEGAGAAKSELKDGVKSIF